MTVHVFGTPDDGMVLEFDERMCDDEDYDEDVVYHVDPRWLTTGGYVCAMCGESTVYTKGSA